MTTKSIVFITSCNSSSYTFPPHASALLNPLSNAIANGGSVNTKSTEPDANFFISTLLSPCTKQLASILILTISLNSSTNFLSLIFCNLFHAASILFSFANSGYSSNPSANLIYLLTVPIEVPKLSAVSLILHPPPCPLIACPYNSLLILSTSLCALTASVHVKSFLRKFSSISISLRSNSLMSLIYFTSIFSIPNTLCAFNLLSPAINVKSSDTTIG